MSREGAFTRTLVSLSRTFGMTLAAEATSRQRGLLQSLDPRVRLAGTFLLVLAVTLSRHASAILLVLLVAIVAAGLSGISVATLSRRVWLVVLAFTKVIVLPALFLTPGDALFLLPVLGWKVTQPGWHSALLLLCRVETAATLTTLLVLTTPWMQLLRALRAFRLPQEAILMLAMTHRYVILLAETTSQMFESRQSRMVGPLDREAQRHVTVRTAGVLLSKSVELSGEVFQAMQSRGFRGEVRALTDFRLCQSDYAAATLFVLLAAFCVWMGLR